MVIAKRDYEWDHTSLVVATLINANKGKGKPVKPEDIHPSRQSSGAQHKGDVSMKLTRNNINMLKHFASNVKPD
jgi:hypothetical protein